MANADEPDTKDRIDRTKDLMRAEFERIKAEQIQRIGLRDNMIFIQFAAMGAFFSFIVVHHDKSELIYVLFWFLGFA